jgi:glutamate/tyrosine decarboxylase-like PLP-dependent enzyme
MRPSQTATLLADAARRAAAYLDALDGRPVAPSAEAVAALSALDGPLPEGPAEPAAVLDELDRRISPATMAMAGPRFFGFVIGGALPATLAASILASAWDQNSAKWAVTPGTARWRRWHSGGSSRRSGSRAERVADS